MSGIVTKFKEDPSVEGRNCWFKVVDHGEGAGADPDQISLFYYDPDEPSLGDCDTDYIVNLYEITGGNIQVKPLFVEE
jgi:hypothetical protein